MSDTAPAGEPAAPAADTAPVETPPAPPTTLEAAKLSASQRLAAMQAEPVEPEAPEGGADPVETPEPPSPAAEPHPWDKALESYGDTERTALLDLVTLLASDPEAGAKEMQRLAQLILEDPDPAPVEQSAEPELPKTLEELDKFLAERDLRVRKAMEEEQEAEQALALAESFGLKRGTLEMKHFLEEAIASHNSDLKAAWEARQAQRQAIIDAYVAEQAAANAAFPVPPRGNAPADVTGGPPKTLEAAKKSMLQRLAGG